MMDATPISAKAKGPEQLVHESLEIIKKLNPEFNMATEIMEKEAHEQLHDIKPGLLHGIPASIKECYAIAGKKIRSGSVRMKPIECDRDATVVQKLKAQGAILVARGNTSEFLLGRETDNLKYGTTRNAINQKLTAGGSSGGDAVMVAKHAVNFAIGTDIGGSCRYPAAFNGIVGFKPASGLIDKTGIFPSAGNAFTESMNSPGILCRSVRDAALVYNAIANEPLKEKHKHSQTKLLTSTGFNVKITDSSISEALEFSVNVLRENNRIEDIDIPESGSLYIDFAVLMCGGFTDKIYEWSKTADGKRLSFMRELFNRMSGKKTVSDELFSMLLPFNFLNPSKSKMEKTIEKVKLLREKYNKKIGNDVLLLPTCGILAPEHGKFISQYNKPGIIKIITPVSFCNILNLSCITIPAWRFQKDKFSSPPALQLACVKGNESSLLKMAVELENKLI
jgi:Asp-tRNA(Asn)/Glu-tRNA(Gln) amidotransferase A subunit family amidase